MSESYTVMPMSPEVRNWLLGEGLLDLPISDGRDVTLDELKEIISSLHGIASEWNNGSEFQDGHLRTANGLVSTIIIGVASDECGHCQFHFRGGHTELIEKVVSALASSAGPQVIHAHSGSYTKVIH